MRMRAIPYTQRVKDHLYDFIGMIERLSSASVSGSVSASASASGTFSWVKASPSQDCRRFASDSCVRATPVTWASFAFVAAASLAPLSSTDVGRPCSLCVDSAASGGTHGEGFLRPQKAFSSTSPEQVCSLAALRGDFAPTGPRHFPFLTSSSTSSGHYTVRRD